MTAAKLRKYIAKILAALYGLVGLFLLAAIILFCSDLKWNLQIISPVIPLGLVLIIISVTLIAVANDVIRRYDKWAVRTLHWLISVTVVIAILCNSPKNFYVPQIQHSSPLFLWELFLPLIKMALPFLIGWALYRLLEKFYRPDFAAAPPPSAESSDSVV